jgi:hypothetical protein
MGGVRWDDVTWFRFMAWPDAARMFDAAEVEGLCGRGIESCDDALPSDSAKRSDAIALRASDHDRAAA